MLWREQTGRFYNWAFSPACQKNLDISILHWRRHVTIILPKIEHCKMLEKWTLDLQTFMRWLDNRDVWLEVVSHPLDDLCYWYLDFCDDQLSQHPNNKETWYSNEQGWRGLTQVCWLEKDSHHECIFAGIQSYAETTWNKKVISYAYLQWMHSTPLQGSRQTLSGIGRCVT